MKKNVKAKCSFIRSDSPKCYIFYLSDIKGEKKRFYNLQLKHVGLNNTWTSIVSLEIFY